MGVYIETENGTLVDVSEVIQADVDVIFDLDQLNGMFSGIHLAPGDIAETKYNSKKYRFRFTGKTA